MAYLEKVRAKGRSADRGCLLNIVLIQASLMLSLPRLQTYIFGQKHGHSHEANEEVEQTHRHVFVEEFPLLSLIHI
mgnify:CR=1 FL=1